MAVDATAERHRARTTSESEKGEIIIEDRIRSNGEHIYRKFLKGRFLGKVQQQMRK